MLQWMKPGVTELITFVTMFVILVILVQIFQSMYIKKKVQKTSKCYQLKYRVQTPTNINVKNTDGVSLYNIKYDIANKQMNLDCACPTGDTVNKFNNIKVYNFATHASEYAHLNCQCDSQYGTLNKNVKTEEQIFSMKYFIQSKIKDTLQLDINNPNYKTFLNKIRVSYKPSFFDSTKYIEETIRTHGNALALTQDSRSTIKTVLDNIISFVLSGEIDISLKSSIKNNIIKNNPNLSHDELNILFLIINKLDNNVINRGNNVIEYIIFLDFNDISNDKDRIIQLVRSLYNNSNVTDNNNEVNITVQNEGTILQSENSKDFVYEGNPDIIRYMESDDMNIFERDIVSDV